uniref:Putative nuclease HARBI1 n=1 Tax=Myripristis murdjan TaxID=586833 RepID=A0A667X6D1_9TELE
MELLWVAAREDNPERPLRDQMDPLALPDHEVLRKYRLPRQLIMDLVDILKEDLQRRTNRSSPLSVALQVMVGLRFFASGSFQTVLGDTVGVSQPSVSRTVNSVSRALCRKASTFIRFPSSAAEQIQVKMGFFELAGFPNVLGMVDGTHVGIMNAFVNRKNFHSINVQIVCDATLKITNLVAKWPWQTHDSFILQTSALGIKFNKGQIPDGWLLGDSGYPLIPWLMTPILCRATAAEERYTDTQRKTCSSRFRCIDRSGGILLYTPEQLLYHNFRLNSGFSVSQSWFTSDRDRKPVLILS